MERPQESPSRLAMLTTLLCRLRRTLVSATLISSLALSEAWAQIPAAPGDEGVAPPDEEPDEAFEPALPPSPVPAPETSGSRSEQIVKMMRQAMANARKS